MRVAVLPERQDLLQAPSKQRLARRSSALIRMGMGLRVGQLVSIGFHGELERFEAVVLRQVGHEGSKGVWIGCGVCEDLFQGGQTDAR